MHLICEVNFKPKAFNYNTPDHSSQGENLRRSNKPFSLAYSEFSTFAGKKKKTALLCIPEECSEAIRRV